VRGWGLGTSTSYVLTIPRCRIQMFILIISPIKRHEILQNSVWQNTIHKNPLATMRDLWLRISLLKIQNPFFTVMWDLLWMAKWLINLMQNGSNNYTMFTWYRHGFPYQNKNFRSSITTGVNSLRYDSHCYEIFPLEKQEGTGMNSYQNENHTLYNVLVSCKHPLRLTLNSSQQCLTTSSEIQGQ